MLRIPLHIERILLVNDCVIIPDFGGFILRRHTAVHNPRECAFLPARKEIVFNPTLTYNDGLLAESYMEMYGMDFNEAQQAIRHDVSALLTTLDEAGELKLSTLGTLRRNDDGALLYDPADETSIYGIGSYGLPIFYIAPLVPEPSVAAPPAIDTPAPMPAHSQTPGVMKAHLPPVALRIVGQTAAVAAAACAFYFAISTPVKDVDQSAYTAGFVPSELLHDLAEKESGIPPQPKSGAEGGAVSAEVTKPEHTPKTAESSRAEAAQSIPVEAAQDRYYYVVIGSFDNRNNARRFIAETNAASTCRHLGIVESDGKVRVYAEKSNDRRQAQAYLHRLRENRTFPSSWLMAVP